MNSKKRKSIADIVYEKLFYKNVKIFIAAAIVFFIVTVSLFVLYQLSVAFEVSHTIKKELEFMALDISQSKKLIQDKYDNSNNLMKNKNKLLNDLKTIVLTHKLCIGAGYITENPKLFRFVYEPKNQPKSKGFKVK